MPSWARGAMALEFRCPSVGLSPVFAFWRRRIRAPGSGRSSSARIAKTVADSRRPRQPSQPVVTVSRTGRKRHGATAERKTRPSVPRRR